MSTDESKLKMLGNLELMKGKHGQRRPYSARAQSEIDEAHASQSRIDEMVEATPEDAPAEDAEEAPSGIDAAIVEVAQVVLDLQKDNARLRQANIALNSKVIANGEECVRLKRILGRMQLEHPEYFGSEGGE